MNTIITNKEIDNTTSKAGDVICIDGTTSPSPKRKGDFFSRRRIKIPKIAIEDDAIGMLYFMRSKFKHPVIKNYSSYRGAKITGRSTNTVKKYVSRLIKAGLAEMRGKDLHLKKYIKKSDSEKYNYVTIDILPFTKWNTFKARLHTALLSRHHAQQNWAGFCKQNRMLKHESSFNTNVKLLAQYTKRYGVGAPDFYDREVFISSRSVARHFNVSQTKANNFLREAERLGYLDREMKIEELNIPPKAFHYIGGHIFSVQQKSRSGKKGAIRYFVHHGVKIFFSSHFLYEVKSDYYSFKNGNKDINAIFKEVKKERITKGANKTD